METYLKKKNSGSREEFQRDLSIERLVVGRRSLPIVSLGQWPSLSSRRTMPLTIAIIFYCYSFIFIFYLFIICFRSQEFISFNSFFLFIKIVLTLITVTPIYIIYIRFHLRTSFYNFFLFGCAYSKSLCFSFFFVLIILYRGKIYATFHYH